ncbi:MAG: heme-binding protein [Lachnospiraceae bacterium]|nr:heme-binding protein [Lachnospiraceae bacterium]
MTDKELYEKCLAEEKKYVFPEFGRNDVWNLGCDIVEATKAFSGPLAVTIWINGAEVFAYYPEGTGRFHDMWLTRKRNTVTVLGMASMTFKAKLAVSGSSLADEGLNSDEFVACGGGFPLRIKGGCVIGFIGCSGLADSEDHAAILAGLDKFFERKGWR